MTRSLTFILGICISFAITGKSQNIQMTDSISRGSIKGYHIGVVQPILAIHNNQTTYLSDYEFYSIGFPFGITLNTSGALLIDLEIVPFIKPYLNDDSKPYEIHLLYHPGILLPLGHGFTAGLRVAFESGTNQFGFTPLINKGFKLSQATKFFIEIVFPGRFGPGKDSGYTQLIGAHIGLAF